MKETDKVVMHYPLGASHGGYGFRGSNIIVKGAEVNQNQIEFPIPQKEALVDIARKVLLTASAHRIEIEKTATVFRALLAKKA